MKEYLGDSVYVELDGQNIILTTNNGHDDDPRNRIVMEPAVYASLLRFMESAKEGQQAAPEKTPEELTAEYVESNEELIQMWRNAFCTGNQCGGHVKGMKNDALVKIYESEMKSRGMSIPKDKDDGGVFNGIGSF